MKADRGSKAAVNTEAAETEVPLMTKKTKRISAALDEDGIHLDKVNMDRGTI